MNRCFVSLAWLACGWAGSACAGAIVGGSALLDDQAQAQLETWLGAGDVTLRKLYTRQPGDTAIDFHRDVDGKGATFTILRLNNALGQSFLVGGFNPQSWSTLDGWHLTPRDAERTAFLFNLTQPAVYRQVPSNDVLPSKGASQTYNHPDYGPTFGTGHDLYVNQTLASGVSWQLSYGNPAEEGLSIVDHSRAGQPFSVQALEVFAVLPIPEPALWTMLVAGLGLLGSLSRRRPSTG